MIIKNPLGMLTIKGFKSIKNLDRFKLHSLNVLIGANGAGKSNFVSYFGMLGELLEGRLQIWTAQQGSADRIVSFGIKETHRIESTLWFASKIYDFLLEPTVDGGFVFAGEAYQDNSITPVRTVKLGSGHKESRVKLQNELDYQKGFPKYCYGAIASWKVYHFHDTSETAGVKRLGAVHDNDYLRSDASNLAAFLYRLSKETPDIYQQICKTIRLAIPFFDDFELKPRSLKTGEEQISLLWRQRDSDYPLWPSQLSDGSIRFICLVTALLQPDAPSTIIIDEPELGLHPYAITLLGALLRSASQRMQVIVSTQSVSLVNQFSINDLIVVEREQGATVFKRHNEQEFTAWLEDYSVSELWEKNILGGRPAK